MHRFFIPPEDIHDDTIEFNGKSAQQIARVLRLKEGEVCVALDNLGSEVTCKLERVSLSTCLASVIEKRKADEPRTRLMMLLCLTQREKFEWILQKCTEIGAASFLPVISQRSLVQKKTDTLAKYERWQMILKEAAEQSGRGLIPQLLPPTHLNEAVMSPRNDYSLRLIPWEDEQQTGIKAVLGQGKPVNVAVLIGPEGGFSSEEVQMATEAGFQRVTLGRRILRMETAAVVSAALIFHELE
ncbi:MAG TPA: RsmE family RNA methyltransferase [Anaerolineaceae bacterium]|nr:RsmE family RNA methyltransferase [Anaerolineaceae bacterium]